MLAQFSKKIINFFKALGPGLVTGASDDDPSGIATYSQAGAQFSYSTLWTAIFTFPLMAAVQGMCARIGIVTQHGLTVTLRDHYSKKILYIMLVFSLPAITLNIGADIQGMGAVAHMIVPKVPVFVFSCFFTGVLLYAIIKYPYQKIAQILKWLCLSLLLYLIVPFMVQQNWMVVLKNTAVPTIKMDKDFISILVAIFGTTISPYLFFWQATMEAEEIGKLRKKVVIDKNILKGMAIDINVGMLLSNLVMFFIILTAASVLNKSGITHIDTVDQAAKSLEPIAGKFAAIIFTLGVIGTGLIAIPVLAGSQSYMLAETFGWKAGLSKKFSQARSFYLTIIASLLVGLSLDFLNISPIQALYYTAILYGITAPILIAIVMHIANNKKIMGDFTNNLLSNILGVITLIVMSVSVFFLFYL